MGSASAWARFLIIFFANNALGQVLRFLRFLRLLQQCLHLHNILLLSRGAIFNKPVVEVERTRDEGG
jgi:hypothetical protein